MISSDSMRALVIAVGRKRNASTRGPNQDEREVAKQFLLDALAGGPKAAAKLKSQGEARAISASTIDRARKDLGIISAKEGKIWFWSLPTE